MATNNDDIKWLYGKLKAKGYNIGTEQEFQNSLANEEDRKWYYEKAKGIGLNFGDMDDFDSLYAPQPIQPSTAQQQPAQKEVASVSTTARQAAPVAVGGAPMPEASGTEQPAMKPATGNLDGFGGGMDAFDGSEAAKRMQHYREVIRERTREDEAKRKEEMANRVAEMEFLKDATDFYTRMAEESKARKTARKESNDEYARMMKEQERRNAEGRKNADKERAHGVEWEDPDYRRELDAIEPEYSFSAKEEASGSRPQHGVESALEGEALASRQHRGMMSEEEARQLSTEAYDGKTILAYDKDRKDVDPITGKGGYIDRTRYPAKARVMKDPEDIWSVRGKVDRTFTSEEPGGLPELSVTGISKAALKRRYDEYLRLHPELGDVAENSDKSRELMGSLRSEMIDEGRAVDEAFEAWKAENPHKVRKMSEEELAGKREEIRADREFTRRIGNLDLERDYIFRRYGERTAELTAALRDEFESKGLKPEGNRWMYALDAALRGDEELKALNVQSYNLGKAAERYEDWIADGKQGSIVNFAQGAGGALKEALMNPFGLAETQGSMIPLMHIKRKLVDDRGKEQDVKAGEGAGSSLSQDEVLALESYFLNQETQGRTKMSLARNSGEFTGALAEMAAEFGLNPASGLARRTLARMVAEVGKDGAMSLIRKSSRLARMVGYKGVEVSGARVAANLGKVTAAALGEGAVMSATTQGLKNFNAAAGRTITEPVYDDDGNLVDVNGENAGSAAVKTGVSSALTNAAFVFPATFGAKVMKGLDNMAKTMHVPFGNPVDALVKMKSGEAMSILTADAVGRSDIDPTWSDFADPEKNGELIMGLLAAELTSGAMRGTANVANGARLRHGREMAKAEMMAKAMRGAEAFNGSAGSGNRLGDWVAVVKAVYEGEESTIVDALARIARDGSMTSEQKEAALDYARSAYRYIGADRAYEAWRTQGEREAAAREAEEDWNVISEDTREMWEDEAYTRGYEAGQSAFAKHKPEEGRQNEKEAGVSEGAPEVTPKEATGETSGSRPQHGDDISREMRDARDRIEDAFSGSEAEYYLAELEENPWDVLENPEITPDQQEVVLDFINAKNAMKGMMDASGDVLDMKRKEIERSVEMRTHKKDNVIIPVVKNTGEEVYLVKGHVAMTPDGKGVDKSNSDGIVYLYNPVSNKYETSAPQFIERVGESINPEEELAAAMSAIEQEQMNVFGNNAVAPEDPVEGVVQQQATEVPATVNTAAYDRGYEQGIASADYTDEELAGAIEASRSYLNDGKLDDFGRGRLEGLEYEQQRRTMESKGVSRTQGNVPDSVEPQVPDVETIPESVSTGLQNESALSRIPRDEAGNPVYEQTDPATAWEGLTESMGGDEAAASELANTMVSNLERRVAGLQKRKLKGQTSAELTQEINERKKAVSAVTQELEHWRAIADMPRKKVEAASAGSADGIPLPRHHGIESEISPEDARLEAERIAETELETERIDTEGLETERAEAERNAEEAWKSQRQRIDQKLRKTADVVRDCPEAVEILENTSPRNIWEAASWVLSTNKLIPRNDGVLKGFREMTGYKSGEQRKLVGLFAKAENGGKTLEKLAEDAMQSVCEEHGIPYDNREALNALLDVLQSCGTVGEIRNYIENNRIDQAMAYYERWRRESEWTPEEEAEYEDYQFRQEYGASREEYENEYALWNEYMAEHLKEIDADFDVNEFYGNIADELTDDRLLTNNGYGSRQREIAPAGDRGDGEIQGYGSAGAGTVSGRGGDVLPAQASVHAQGARTDGEGSGVYEENGDGGIVPPSAVSAESSRGDVLGTSGLSDGLGSSGLRPQHGEEPTEVLTGEATERAAKEPTEAQKAAGNYKMEHRRVDGYNISIENTKGSVRRGTGADGKPWETAMQNDYGYIRGTEGVDGDHIDVFLSDTPEEGDVFVIDQVNEDGSFDEHKVMYGFPSEQAARDAYLSNYEPGWTGLGAITHVSKDEFKKWIQSSTRKTKPFAEYKSVKAIAEDVDQTPTNVDTEGMVVDGEGKALTLYHGTPNDVEALSDLEAGHLRKGTDEPARFNGDGVSFTPHRDVAEDYASLGDGNNGKVFEANVILKNPYYTVGVANFTPEEAAEFTASLKAKGHDGIINYASQSMRQMGAEPNEVIVFDIGSAVPAATRSKFDRTVPATPEAQRSAISRIIDFAKSVKNRVERAVIGGITKRQAKDFADNGIDVDETWVHSFESSAVAHNQKHHGNDATEASRGQIAISIEDYARIPDILENYDRVSKSPNTSHRTGNEVIIYEKEFGDGYVYYLEEKRDNRKSLAFQTMYKKKKGTDSSDGLMHNASTSTPLATSDNLSSNSDGKDNALSADKQAIEGESFESEYGEGVVNAFNRYIASKNAEGFEDKESEIEACEKLLDSLKERVGRMNEEELVAVERDIDSLVERESATDDGRAWLVSDFAHWVSRYAGLDKRRSEIERQRTLDNAVDAAQELTSAVPRKTKVRIDRFVDKRENSRLGGVYHDASRVMAVASDSRMLVMSAKDYKPENAGKVIAADGVKDVKYPDVARVIPSEDYCIARDAVDFGMLEGMAEDAMRQGKSEAVADRSPQIAVRSVNNEYAIVDALVLRDFARGARHVGATEVGMYRSGETSWLVANGKDGLSLMIGKLYEPEKTLYRVSLGESSGKGYAGTPGTLEMAEEVAAGYGAARESQDAWFRGESVARQMNLFDFDFSDNTGLSAEGSTRGNTSLGSRLGTEKKEIEAPRKIETTREIEDLRGIEATKEIKAPKRVKSNLFDFDFSDEKPQDKGSEQSEKQNDKGIEPKEKPEDKGIEHKDKPDDKGFGQKEKPQEKGLERSEPKRQMTIEDFGEKIAGARKDILRDLSRNLGNVNVESLVKLSLSKAIKRPDFGKMVERGAMTEDEAMTAEAMWQEVYSSRKPAATSNRRRAIVEWAENTERKIRRLEDFINSDSKRRREIMEGLSSESFPDQEREALNFRKIQDLNPTKKFDVPLFTPSAAWVNRRVMEASGMRPGSGMKIEFSIRPNLTYQYYELNDASGHRVMGFPSTRDLESAVDMVTLATRMHNGDLDVEYPSRFFNAKGRNAIFEPTGEFEVGWLKGHLYKNEICPDEETANKKAESLNARGMLARVYPVKRHAGYEDYAVRFKNPISGEEIVLDDSYPDRETALQMIEDDPLALSQKVNSIFAERQNDKKAAKDHFFVTVVYEDHKLSHAVCRNNVGGKMSPWAKSVVKKFESRADAAAWLKENRDRLESEYTEMMKRKRSFVYFEQGEGSRKGEDYRKGVNVTPEQFSDTFGFRGVQFGNWTNDADRQAALNEAYDALRDLAAVLGLDNRALSLNGELGLAFGSRGSGSANAHYESGEVVINLTKTRGAGSLAHEWWHALDNYLMRKAGVANGYATEHLSGKSKIRSEIAAAITGLVKAVGGSDYSKRSLANGDYWGRIIEQTARLFGEWVVMKQEASGNRNYFLSRGIVPSIVDAYRAMTYADYKGSCRDSGEVPVSLEEWKTRRESLGTFPYPTSEEVKELSAPMERVFEALRKGGDGGLAVTEIAMEPAIGYSQGSLFEKPRMRARQLSLFDNGFENMELPDKATVKVDAAVDEYSEALAEIFKYPEDAMPEDVLDQMWDKRDSLMNTLNDYFRSLGNNEKDAADRAREMLVTLQAQVSVAALRKHNGTLDVSGLRPHRGEEIPLPRHHGKREETANIEETGSHLREVTANMEETGSNLEEVTARKDEKAVTAVEDNAGMVAKESEVVTRETAGGDLLSYRHNGLLRELGEGEFSLMERRFSETGEFHFSGDSKIESADDVAYMMRNLEMKSVEHSFAVLTKDGVPTVVHLGMGGFAMSPVNLAAVKAADNALGGADRIWFVHNHPSGNLGNSPQDMSLHIALQDMFGDRLEPSIILDTLRGQYAEFGKTGNTDRLRPSRSRNGEEEVRVYQFDRAVYSKDYDFSKLSKIGASGDVAAFLSGYRLGEGEKAGVLIINQMNQIVGNLPCTHSIDSPEGVDAIVNYAIHGGGTSVIVYGNDVMSRGKLAKLGEGIGARSGRSIRLLDVITRNGNDFTSANDAGIMEPEARYGETSGLRSQHSEETNARFRDGESEERRKIATADRIEELFDKAVRGDLTGKPVEVGTLTKDGKAYLEKLSGIKMKDEVSFVLNPSDLVHMYRDHYASNEKDKGNNIPLDKDDIRAIADIIVNPERVIFGKEPDGLKRNLFYFLSSAQEGTYNLLEIYGDRKGNLTAKTFYKTRKGVSQRVLSLMKSEHLTSVTDGATLSGDAKLPKFFEYPKSENDPDIRLREGDAIISGTDTKEKEDRVTELSDKLGVPVRIITTPEDINNLSSVRQRKSKGYWSSRDGVVVILPNNRDVADVENTFVHEVVGHKGLRALIGEERFDEFLSEVYDHSSDPIRRVIDKMTDDMVNAEVERLRAGKAEARERAGEDVNANYYADMAGARLEAEARRADFRREATEEYMADLGGRIGNDGFEKMSLEELTLWGKIKAKVQQFLDRFLQGLKIAKSIQLTDKDLAYILYKSWKNIRERGASGSRSQHGGVFAEAEDVVMRRRTGWDDAMLSESAKIEDANNRFNRQLKRYINGDMDKNEVLHLGKPQGIMRQFLPELPIVLRQRVIRKGSEKKHEVDVKSIMNMPQHLSYPIFVFQQRKNTIGVLTDMQDRNGKNVCVAIELKRQIQKGGEYLEINDVRSFHGREFKNIVEPIVNNNTLKWVDKEKGLAYLSSASQPVQQEIDKQVLEDATKIIKSFENPKFEGDEDVRFRDGADYVEHNRVLARAMYEKQLQTNMYQFTEAMQDSMRGLMEFYRAVESQDAKRSIEDVASFENAYTDENRLSSRSHAEMEEYEHRIMRPLLDIAARMAVNKKGCQDLTDYMMAKHGLERNAYMRNEALAKGEKTGRDFAGLCGLTGKKDWRDAENAAQQMVDDYEKLHSSDINELWKAVNTATKTSLKKVYDCGLLSKEQYEKIRDMYDYYIPLRGFDEKTSDDVYGYLTSKEGWFSSPIKKAQGRKSKADDPLATIAYMANNSIIQGNRNLMKQKFLTYVQNHPSDLASINKLWLVYDDAADTWKPVFADIKDGMSSDEVYKAVIDFEERMETLSKSEPDKYKRGRDALNIPYRLVDGNVKEHQVIVKRNGESYVVTINGNPRAAQAVNGLTNPDNDLNGAIGKVFNLANYINRQLSQVYTTRNPDFIVSNFIRDFLYSNTMVHVKEDPRYAFKFHWNYAKTNPIRMIRLLHLYEADKLDMHKPVHRMFYEFMHWGGETGYTMQRDLEQEKKLVKQLITEARRGKLNPKSIWNLICNKLDQINRGVENSARFAAFITSRENGRDVQRSVYDAKEISVNFNKKGAGSKFMDAKGQTLVGKSAGFVSGLGRSFYVFWNAAVQGLTNFFRTSAKHPWRAIPAITSLVVLGYLNAALNDDDDDEDKDSYYNMPKYIRRSNLMFRAGEQWVTIPLSVEYRAIYGLGELAYGVTSGREEYTNMELAKEISAQLSQILPLDVMEGGGGLNALVPSAFKPLYESATNVSWTGLPIYKDTPFNKDMPEWTKAYPRTNAQLVDLSKIANEASGGNDYKAGSVNINPAQLEYILNGYLGGYSNIVNKMVKTGETMIGEREYDPSSILLLNRLVKMGDERTSEKKINSDFFNYMEEYKRTHSLLRKYEDEANRGSDKYSIFLDALKHSRDGARHNVMDEYVSDYNWLNKTIKDPDITDDERQIYEDEMRRLKRKVVSLMKVAHDSIQVNKLTKQFAEEYAQQ